MRYLYCLTFFLCLSVLRGLNGFAQEEKYIGLFVFNFTKYFEWPITSKTGNFVIVVVGHESVYDELKKLTAGRTVGTQNIVIKNYETLAGIDNLNTCHMLFLGHWQSRFLPDIQTKLGPSPTLLITEMEGLASKGSDINFVIREGSIKFELNTSSIKKRNLKTDARILELAYKVIQ